MGDDLPSAAAAGLTGYPNPFNPRTVLRFDVPRPGRIRLEIFNIRGGLVRTLIDGPIAQGPHQVLWDGKDRHGNQVSSGTYLARLQPVAGPPATRKLMLVR